MDLPIVATEAAALLAQGVMNRTAVSDRLFHAVGNKFTRRAADSRALENLVQEPGNTRHRGVVAAALTDAIAEDPRFGDELRQVVAEVKQAYGYYDQSAAASGNQLAGDFGPGTPLAPKRRPRIFWRLVELAVGLVVVGTAAYAIINHDGTDEQPTASDTGGGRAADNLVLPTNPYEAVRMIYHEIAGGDEQGACSRFTAQARAEFAGNLGYRTCGDAVADLERQVTDKNDYAESMPSYKPGSTGDSVRISSCTDNINGEIRGGPALGAFTVTGIRDSVGAQWIISGHESEVC